MPAGFSARHLFVTPGVPPETDTTARRVGFLLDCCIGPDVAAPFCDLIGKSRTAVPLRRGGNTEKSCS